MNSPRRFTVTLRAPNRRPVDLTAAINARAVGSISESVEDTLLSLSHSSMTMTLDDPRGELWGLFSQAQPDERWEITVDRQTKRRRPFMERVFGGVLDLPWSLSRDLKARTIDLQVFSYSKVMEQASAENVKRTFAALTGSIASGATALTLSDTTGLQRNDVVKLDNGTGTTEELTISEVTGSTTATTKANASNTFTTATATVSTPYYRDVTPEAVVDLLVAEAGFSADSVNVMAQVASYPVPTPVSEKGSRGFASGKSLTVRGGSLEWTSASPRQVATSPTAGWTAGTASAQGVFDWSPYYATEPGTIKSLQNALGQRDDGSQITRYNNVSARTYAPTTTATQFTIDDDTSATLVTIDTVASGGYSWAFLEYDPVNDGIWSSYKRGDGTREALEFYDFSTTAQSDIDVAAGVTGRLRCCRALGIMVVHAGTTFRVYDLATKVLTRIVNLPAEAANLAMWSLRVFDGFVCVTGQDANGNGSRAFFWESTNWTFVKSYALTTIRQGLGSAIGGGLIPHVVPFTLADGQEVAVVDAIGTMLVLSRRYDGVIPYADGSSKSCAALLAEIAGLMIQSLDVTPYEVVRFRPRMASGAAIASLDDPLDGDEQPLWDDYRASFKITGKDSAGVDIEFIAGDSGDSARRGDRSVAIALTSGMAQTVAEAANSFFSVKRRQVDGTWIEPHRRVRPYDIVRTLGRDWIVLESQLDAINGEQDLKLVEA